MKGYHANIESLTEANDKFRRVLYTGHSIQLVLMTLLPGEEIGAETHDDRDQFFRFEAGTGEVDVDETTYRVEADDVVIVPQGACHNVRATGSEPLRMYTVYGPPEHLDGKIHQTKAEADADEEHFDGRTSE